MVAQARHVLHDGELYVLEWCARCCLQSKKYRHQISMLKKSNYLLNFSKSIVRECDRYIPVNASITPELFKCK